MSVGVVFLGKAIFFVKNLQCCLEGRKNLSSIIQNLSTLYLKFRCFFFLLFLKMPILCFFGENHYFPDISIFRPMFSITLLCSIPPCSVAARWYTKR